MPWRPWWLLLALLRCPGLLPAAAYLLVYNILDRRFCDAFCADAWKPAWPARWRVYILALVAAVLFSALYLSWLMLSGLVFPALWRTIRPTDSDRRLRGGTDTQYILLELDDPDRQSFDGPRMLSTALKTPAYRTRSWWLRVLLSASVALYGFRSMTAYENPADIRYRAELEHALAHPRPEGYFNDEKVFIAALFYNNEAVLPYWSDTMVKVIQYLGPANVFVSIVESHSDDGTRGHLHALDARLEAMGVPRRIVLDERTVPRPAEMSWNARIEFLSALRNRALEPLVARGGFDTVLFSNDVYVEPESVVELLKTAEGEYDMACGLDFQHFGLYDAWVIRDRIGRLTSTQWPYFLDAADYEAMKAEAPVPVFTCWNGIVAIKAEPLLPVQLRANRTLSTSGLARALPATHPAAQDARLRGPSPALTPAARFRASAAGECYSSECFLLPYDLRRQFGLERVFVNPRVHVAYIWKYYVWFKWVVRHWAVRWWVERVWDGAWMERAMMVVGPPEKVYTWDGGECHPWV